MTEIKHICFDIGRVATTSTTEAIVSAGKEKWTEFDIPKFKRMLRPSDESGRNYWREFQKGLIPPDEFLTAAVVAGGYPNTRENKQHFAYVMRAMAGQPYGKVVDLARKLGRNHHTSAFTNSNEIMFDTPAAQIAEVVDLTVCSHLIHVCKPDPESYRILLDRIEAKKPEEVLFIDDKAKNIVAAQELGIKGYVFRSGEMSMDDAFVELVDYLRREGVEW